MNKINDARVIVGGIVGGLAAYVVDYVLNGVVFKDVWISAVAKGLCNLCTAKTAIPELIIVVLVSLIGTYIYALARPRLGGSVASAIRVSVLVGLLISLTSGVGALVWSTMSQQACLALIASGLVVPMVGTFVGAWVYKE